MVFCGGVPGPRRRSREKAMVLTMVVILGIYSMLFGGRREREEEGSWESETLRRSWGTWRPQATAASRTSTSSLRSSPDSVSVPQALVVASLKNDDTSWLFSQLPAWQKNIYVVDDRHAELTVPLNKGRESMVYLT